MVIINSEPQEPQRERRKDQGEILFSLSKLEKKLNHLTAYLESEFGGINLAGQPTQGNITRNFNELGKKIKDLQDKNLSLQKKVDSLNLWKAFVVGGFSIIVLLTGWLINISKIFKGG